MTNRIGPPSLIHTFAEVARAPAEFLAMKAAYRALLRFTPQGDGRPVLVLPGFLCGDIGTAPLRQFLTEKGYAVRGWENGINFGPSRATLAWLKTILERMHADHGGQKVTIIGHSLGGVYARELARAFPEKVSQAISLGSPLAAGLHPESTAGQLRQVFEFLNGKDHPFLNDPDLAQLAIEPPPVPTSSIYSRSDGIVHWMASVSPRGSMAENIEVPGSHCGMTSNPFVFLLLADRLAQDIQNGPEQWRPFDRRRHPVFALLPAPAHEGREPALPERKRIRDTASIFVLAA